MQWLNSVVDELISLHPDGVITVSSGVSPSGTYHLGTLREVLTAEAVLKELKRRGRQAKHLHIVDDLDVFRKVPVNVPEEYKKYLGMPLCDIPSPDGVSESYADFYLNDLLSAAEKMNLQMEIVRANKKYREGFFVEAIETSLEKIEEIKNILEEISGHKVDENWSPIQVIEEGYLKNRRFVSFDKDSKELTYSDNEGNKKQISYAQGQVKLNWRIDWPARWWLMNVEAEPFGRDHATKGGSYDTGKVIAKDIFGVEAPLPLPYNFINRTGETKKMSKSAGDVISANELLELLPPEVIWYFILRSAPSKQLFFDSGQTLVKLVDEFGELLAKTDKTDIEKQLVELCMQGIEYPTVSRVPFSLLVSSYQAALKNLDETVAIISRTEYSKEALEDAETIKRELSFIDNWLKTEAPEDLKFELQQTLPEVELTNQQKSYLTKLAQKIENAPHDADGAWFHQTIYDLKDESGLEPKLLFQTLYMVILNKKSGPRAGWFLSILHREWLIKRLKLEA